MQCQQPYHGKSALVCQMMTSNATFLCGPLIPSKYIFPQVCMTSPLCRSRKHYVDNTVLFVFELHVIFSSLSVLDALKEISFGNVFMVYLSKVKFKSKIFFLSLWVSQKVQTLKKSPVFIII